MKKVLFLILSAVLLVGISGCSTSRATVQHKTPTPAPTATLAPFTTPATALSKNGLSLTVSLNSTVYQQGDSITVTIDEKNTLTTANNITAANEWPVSYWLGAGSCNTLNYPFGIAVVQGYYDANSISAATPLKIFPLIYCPYESIAYSYNFQPSSDLAYINTSFGSEPSPIRMNINITLTGVWDNWTNTGSETVQAAINFPSGIYTLVGGDEWGTLVILHFRVS